VLEGDCVGSQLLSRPVRQLTRLAVGRRGLDGAEAGVGAGGSEGSSGGCRLALAGAHAVAAEEGLLYRSGAVWLGVGKVVGGGEEELGGRLLLLLLHLRLCRPRVRSGSQARRAGLRARCRCPLEFSESAGFGAVGSRVGLDLLVTGEAELVGPQVGHAVHVVRVLRGRADYCLGGEASVTPKRVLSIGWWSRVWSLLVVGGRVAGAVYREGEGERV
jgi:hypothetical protein